MGYPGAVGELRSLWCMICECLWFCWILLPCLLPARTQCWNACTWLPAGLNKWNGSACHLLVRQCGLSCALGDALLLDLNASRTFSLKLSLSFIITLTRYTSLIPYFLGHVPRLSTREHTNNHTYLLPLLPSVSDLKYQYVSPLLFVHTALDIIVRAPDIHWTRMCTL